MTTTRCAVSVRSLPWGATDMPVAPPNTAAPRRALHGARCRPASLLLLARRWTHRAQRSPFRAAPRCEQASPTYGATLATKGKTWTWRGHKINYVREGQGPAIVLLHGFGANLGHYRRTIPALAAGGHTVYAVDLLGFGASDKPGKSFAFSIDAWAQLVTEFTAQVVGAPVVLVGNSIGSLISLQAAALDAGGQQEAVVRGVVLLNCAGGMNSKFILELPDWRFKVFAPLFWLFDIIFNSPLMPLLFARIASKDNITSALQNVYVDPTAVDAELVDIFYGPSQDAGALDTFVAILTGFPGPMPDQVMPKVRCPVAVLWGEQDGVTALDGPVGKYFRQLAADGDPRVQIQLIPNANHCPQDDTPQVVNEGIIAFAKGTVKW